MSDDGVARVKRDPASRPKPDLSRFNAMSKNERHAAAMADPDAQPATEDDIQAGIAVFCMPSGSVPHLSPLPACAIHHDLQNGVVTPVIVIQAEDEGGRIVLGARPLTSGNLVCLLEEVQLLDEPLPHLA